MRQLLKVPLPSLDIVLIARQHRLHPRNADEYTAGVQASIKDLYLDTYPAVQRCVVSTDPSFRTTRACIHAVTDTFKQHTLQALTVGNQTCKYLDIHVFDCGKRETQNGKHFVPGHTAVLRPINHPYTCILRLPFVMLKTDSAVARTSPLFRHTALICFL